MYVSSDQSSLHLMKPLLQQCIIFPFCIEVGFLLLKVHCEFLGGD